MIKIILGLTMIGCLVVVYVADGFTQLKYALQKRETRIEYLCAKSGIEYVQTIRGLAAHVYSNGQPVKCDRWKAYEK